MNAELEGHRLENSRVRRMTSGAPGSGGPRRISIVPLRTAPYSVSGSSGAAFQMPAVEIHVPSAPRLRSSM